MEYYDARNNEYKIRLGSDMYGLWLWLAWAEEVQVQLVQKLTEES